MVHMITDGIRKQVMEKLHELEEKEHVRTLYAAETGSRAWGFPSKDSDWDVRFIYVHPLSWYVSVASGRDVIEYMSDDRLLDLVGWDIKKALTMLRRCTPSLNEWLNSPLPYYIDQEFLDRVKSLENDTFYAKRGMYHYYSLALNVAKEKLEGHDCRMKPFLYYLRGLLACRWIEKYMTPPPVFFHELMQATILDKDVKSKVESLVNLKRESEEHDTMIIDQELLDYAKQIEEYYIDINSLEIEDARQSRDKDLDSIILDMILKYDNNQVV